MAEAKSRYIDYYPDEYISGVAAKMPYELQGMYWMICSLIMSNGGPIENDIDHLARLGCLSRTKAKNLLAQIIKTGKIIENDSTLGQKRAENEVKKAIKRIETAQNNGAKGGRPRKENKDLEKPGGLFDENLTINHQPSTINKYSDYKIILADKSFFNPTLEDVSLWQKSYPKIDVGAELLKMVSWHDANTSRRKTKSGIKRSITNWLGKAQKDAGDRTPERKISQAPSAGTPEADRLELEAYGEPFRG